MRWFAVWKRTAGWEQWEHHFPLHRPYQRVTQHTSASSSRKTGTKQWAPQRGWVFKSDSLLPLVTFLDLRIPPSRWEATCLLNHKARVLHLSDLFQHPKRTGACASQRHLTVGFFEDARLAVFMLPWVYSHARGVTAGNSGLRCCAYVWRLSGAD